MKKLIVVILACAFAGASTANQYSCLSIITAAKEAGKWDALKAWIVSAGLKDEWDKCSYVSDEYPSYAQITNALVSSGTVTSAEIREILAKSTDAAVHDGMIRRVYSNDCQTVEGRRRWHGKVTRTLIDTTAKTKTQIHEDGYVHVTPFNNAVPSSIEEKISSAERKAKREEQKRLLAEAEAKKKAERISNLQTNMTALATALAAKKQYPLDLATMLLQHELNTLVGTNVVNMTVTPGGN